jgi:hypothetical protein
MVYGARFGVAELPVEWMSELKARQEITSLLG